MSSPVASAFSSDSYKTSQLASTNALYGGSLSGLSNTSGIGGSNDEQNILEPEKLLQNAAHASSIEDLQTVLQQIKVARSSNEQELQGFMSSASTSHSQEARKLTL